MIIGVPKEIKNNEFRVSIIPKYVQELTAAGHTVVVEKNAGLAVGYSDQDYQSVGADIISNAADIFSRADLIVKVKEPQKSELKLIKPQQILFTYLHLAPDIKQTQALINSGATCIAYETVEDQNGRLPLLHPMSEVAGRMAVQVGAHYLEKPNGGTGILLGGVTGVKPAKVLIMGAGTVAQNAAQIAIGMGANVTIMVHSKRSEQRIKNTFDNQVTTCFTNEEQIHQHIINADMIIGAVLVPGAKTPHLVTRQHLKQMKNGAVLIDVSIDQGGCFETSRPTTHENPTYIIDGVLHYCVANIPGAVPKTSSQALNNATHPFILKLANMGLKHTLLEDEYLRKGLNIYKGQVTCENVALSQNQPYTNPLNLLDT